MSEAAQVPQLRFPEFGGEWINQKAGDFFEQLSGFAFKGKDISEEVGGTSILRGINITEGSIRHSQKIDKYYLGDVSNLQKYIVQQGDIVLGMDGSKVGKNVAVISSADAGSILIQRVARLRDNGVGCIQFIYHHIFSYRFHRYVDVVNTSSGIPHISSSQINNFPIISPTKLEQQKIAAFLSAVDNKIEQLSKKQALLGEYKKGLMQQIFSQAIRFKADDGSELPDWEEKTFKQLAKLQRGSSPRPIVRFITKSDDGVNWIKIGDTKSNDIYINSTEQKITKKGAEKSRKVNVGEIILSNSMSYGKPYLLNIDGCIHDGWFVIRSYEANFDKVYLHQLLGSELVQKQYKRLAAGGVVSNISSELVNAVKINLPAKLEQTKIAAFITSVDDKIEQVGKQLDESKQFKKALFQQMFV